MIVDTFRSNRLPVRRNVTAMTRQRALQLIALPALLAAAAAAAAPGAPVDPNGRLAFDGQWAEERFDQVFSVSVATGEQRSLTPARSTAGSLAAVSPDGATILFQRDSIWRMDADGGRKRELAPGSEPAWSRDGKRIAYVDATGFVATMTADGRDRERLARGNLPSWSPDGRRIAYVERGSPVRVMLVGADGSGSRLLYTTTDTFLSVLWSPDGSDVVVAAVDVIVRLAADGGAERVLARDVAGLTDPQWSPDGDRLAFARSSRLFTISASGGDLVPLTVPAQDPWGIAEFDSSPRWSPDGRSVAFIRTVTNNPRGQLVRQEIWTVPAGGGDARQVTNLTADRAFRTNFAWSGDGGELVYSRALLFNRSGVLSVRPDGTKVSRLAPGAREPAFSPDGRSIAFIADASPSLPDSGELFVMRSDGSGVRQLTRSVGGERSPSWSPDGSRIVFNRFTRGPNSLTLHTIRADGTGLTLLPAASGGYTEPAWSPDGGTIAVVRGGELITMDENGSRPRLVPGLAGRGRYVSDPAWSPNGARISFVRMCYVPTCAGIDVSLWTVGPRGENPRRLIDNAYHAAWSPDGTRLAVVEATSRRIRTFSERGRPLRRLAFVAGHISWQPACSLSGGPRADRLSGTASSELICGLGGADRITGRHGRDRLFGGEGNDTIDARDGAFDVVGCGPGTDTAHVDPLDYVGVDCERVTRR